MDIDVSSGHRENVPARRVAGLARDLVGELSPINSNNRPSSAPMTRLASEHQPTAMMGKGFEDGFEDELDDLDADASDPEVDVLMHRPFSSPATFVEQLRSVIAEDPAPDARSFTRGYHSSPQPADVSPPQRYVPKSSPTRRAPQARVAPPCRVLWRGHVGGSSREDAVFIAMKSAGTPPAHTAATAVGIPLIPSRYGASGGDRIPEVPPPPVLLTPPTDCGGIVVGVETPQGVEQLVRAAAAASAGVRLYAVVHGSPRLSECVWVDDAVAMRRMRRARRWAASLRGVFEAAAGAAHEARAAMTAGLDPDPLARDEVSRVLRDRPHARVPGGDDDAYRGFGAERHDTRGDADSEPSTASRRPTYSHQGSLTADGLGGLWNGRVDVSITLLSTTAQAAGRPVLPGDHHAQHPSSLQGIVRYDDSVFSSSRAARQFVDGLGVTRGTKITIPPVSLVRIDAFPFCVSVETLCALLRTKGFPVVGDEATPEALDAALALATGFAPERRALLVHSLLSGPTASTVTSAMPNVGTAMGVGRSGTVAPHEADTEDEERGTAPMSMSGSDDGSYSVLGGPRVCATFDPYMTGLISRCGLSLVR